MAASMAASCFTSSDYDKSIYYIYTERYYSYGKLLIHAERDDDD